MHADALKMYCDFRMLMMIEVNKDDRERNLRLKQKNLNTTWRFESYHRVIELRQFQEHIFSQIKDPEGGRLPRVLRCKVFLYRAQGVNF